VRRIISGSLLVLVLIACTMCTPKKDAPPPTTARRSGLDVKTEEEWIVSEVARNIAVWALGASESAVSVSVDRLTSAAAGPAYRVRVGDRSTTLDFKEYIWSPETFSHLLPVAGIPPAVCDTSDLLKRLLTPTVAELARADEVISEQLARSPRDPCLHEKAALLLGSFEMREAWSQMMDARPVLNRMTAHLAIARAGRAGPTPPGGTIADLLLRSIAWRHDGFRELLRDRAAAAPEPEKTWLRVVALYAVQDWRELPNPGKATLAERAAYLLALSNKTNANLVLDFMDQSTPEPVADWTRLAFVRGSSVESCHRFGQTGSEVILGEIAEVYKLAVGRALERNELIRALNEEATDRKVGRVLGWPLWAAFEQRSLLAVLMNQESCVASMFGMPQEAAALRRSIESSFAGLRGYPLLLRHMARSSAEYRRAVDGSVRLVKERPDLVNWSSWVYTGFPTSLGPSPPDLPPEHEWFAPRLPYGTAFDYNMRQWERDGHASNDLSMLEEAQKHVYHALCRKLSANARYHGRAPVSVLKPLYGFIAEFDRDAMVSIAEAARDSDPAEFKSAAGAMCRMSVDDCSSLAEYLKDHGEPEEAARVYQRWVGGARDRVGVSNQVDWLVNYYADHGQRERALSIARMAADVYSFAGLETMGKLDAKLGRPDEAERYFVRIYERYDHPGPLVEFLVARRREPRFQAALDQVIKETFPKGQERFQNSGFGPARPDGVYIVGLAAKKYEMGFVAGDVVVGLDGVRVRSLKQLRVLRRLSTDERVRVAFWRRGKLLEGEFPRDAFAYQAFADDQPE